MLACLAVLLITGPLMAAAGGIPISAFGLVNIRPALAANAEIFDLLLRMHSAAAAVIGGLMTVHVAGVVKHMVIDRDGTFDRIMIAGKPPSD